MSSLQVDYKFEGLDALIADTKKAGINSPALVKAALVNSSSEMQSQMRQRAAHRTGTLQRSVLAEIDPDGMSATVSVAEKYGIFIEQGTGIFGPLGTPIVPKRARVLAWKGSGGMVFARSVKGIKAKPFFVPGYEASISYIDNQFTIVSDKLMAILAGGAQ